MLQTPIHYTEILANSISQFVTSSDPILENVHQRLEEFARKGIDVVPIYLDIDTSVAKPPEYTPVIKPYHLTYLKRMGFIVSSTQQKSVHGIKTIYVHIK